MTLHRRDLMLYEEALSLTFPQSLLAVLTLGMIAPGCSNRPAPSAEPRDVTLFVKGLT